MSISEIVINHVTTLHDHYREMWDREKNDENKVQLGRSFRITDKLQFDFAKELSKIIDCDKILVDYPITIIGEKKTIYPDILIIKSKVITAIIEMKIDLGFLNLDSFGIIKKDNGYEYNSKINVFKTSYDSLIKAGKATYKKKSGKREHAELRINKQVKKKFLIITKKNDHGRESYFTEAIRDANFEILFLLRESTHPNRHYDLTEEVTKELRKKSARIDSFFADL